MKNGEVCKIYIERREGKKGHVGEEKGMTRVGLHGDGCACLLSLSVSCHLFGCENYPKFLFFLKISYLLCVALKICIKYL